MSLARVDCSQKLSDGLLQLWKTLDDVLEEAGGNRPTSGFETRELGGESIEGTEKSYYFV